MVPGKKYSVTPTPTLQRTDGYVDAFLSGKPARMTKTIGETVILQNNTPSSQGSASASMTSGTERYFRYPASPANGEMEVMERL